jgi:hypothetical protein
MRTRERIKYAAMLVFEVAVSMLVIPYIILEELFKLFNRLIKKSKS